MMKKLLKNPEQYVEVIRKSHCWAVENVYSSYLRIQTTSIDTE
jgi:hypothetical protein